MTKKESELLAVLVERIENIKEDTDKIIKHQEYQNGKLADTILKVNKTKEIADQALALSQKNERIIFRMCLIAAFAFGAGGFASFGISSLIG